MADVTGGGPRAPAFEAAAEPASHAANQPTDMSRANGRTPVGGRDRLRPRGRRASWSDPALRLGRRRGRHRPDDPQRGVLLDAGTVRVGQDDRPADDRGLRAARLRAASQLDGVDVTGRPPFERDVNTVFQDYALFPHMTVARQRRLRAPGADGFPGPSARERAEEALAQVRLDGHRRPQGRPSSRVASASGSPSPGRWWTGRRCCCSTSRSARSTSSSASRCRSSSRRSSATSASPSSSSPTTRTRRSP